MNQPPPNSDSQQPSNSPSSQQQAEGETHSVKGDNNRVIQGNDNQSVQGDNSTVTQAKIQGDNNLMLIIKQFVLGQQALAPVGNPARPENQRLLLIRVKEEVTVRLKQSLHNLVLINLGKESQPQQVKRSWDAQIKIGLKPAESLPETTTILEVFNSEEVAGKLLILGAPGAGKTTTQLELAQALIKRAEEQPDYPIPVLLDLFSWNDEHQSLTDWMVAELKSKHGFSTKLGKDWVENRQLLPMLDGLDELEPQRQEPCIQAINQFLQGECRPHFLVVSSRSEEYTQHKTKFYLNGAIYLQTLTDIQIDQYFAECNHVQLKEFVFNDVHLYNLIKIPFFLSVILLIYQQTTLEEWRQLDTITHEKIFGVSKLYIECLKKMLASPFKQKILFNNFHFFINTSFEDLFQLMSSQVRINFLLTTCVEKMLLRPIENNPYKEEKTPAPKKIKYWLIWLATYMNFGSKTEFIIEDLQPSSLDYFNPSYFNFNKYMYNNILVNIPFLILLFLITIPNNWLNFSVFGVKYSILSIVLIAVIKNVADLVD